MVERIVGRQEEINRSQIMDISEYWIVFFLYLFSKKAIHVSYRWD